MIYTNKFVWCTGGLFIGGPIYFIDKEYDQEISLLHEVTYTVPCEKRTL